MQERKTEVSRIYQRIWKAIVERELRPGTRLKEEQLSTVFGVNRARVRQVLARLQEDGLVTIFPNRGAFVSEPDVEEARDVFFLRKQVEARILERVIDRVSKDDVEELEAHFRKEQEVHIDTDRHGSVELSGEFHLILAKLSGSDFLYSALRDLVIRSSLIMVMYSRKSVRTCGREEHGELIEKIKASDRAGALDCMRKHLTQIEEELDLNQDLSSSQDVWQTFKDWSQDTKSSDFRAKGII